MFEMFKRKNRDEALQKNSAPAYTAVKSFYGIARHILPRNDHATLCGYSEFVHFSDTELTVESVCESLPRQHKGHFWCYACASIFTGVSEEDVNAWRD